MSERMLGIQKPGGSSMVYPVEVEESRKHRIEQDGMNRCASVVSAIGIGANEITKTTDDLYGYAYAVEYGKPTVATDIKDSIIDRYDRRYSDLDARDLEELRNTFAKLFNSGPADLALQQDYFASLGEDASARYHARLTGAKHLDSFVRFGRTGNLLRSRSIEGLARLYKNGTISTNDHVVCPGYYGYGPEGQRFTLDRGGSDRTGALFARALAKLVGDAGVIYENLTDRPIYNADWRLVPLAQSLRELSRRLVREGAHGGNPVLQGDTIVDLDGSDLLTIVASTFNLNMPGTRVVADHMLGEDYPGTPQKPVVAVSGRKLVEVNIDDLGMSNQRGYLKRLLGMAAAHGLSVEHTPLAQDYATITLHEKADEAKLEAFTENVQRRALSRHATVTHRPRGVVYLVGDHLRDELIKTRTVGQVCTLLAEEGYGANDVSDGQSPSIALLVQPDAVEPLQQLLHSELIAV